MQILKKSNFVVIAVGLCALLIVGCGAQPGSSATIAEPSIAPHSAPAMAAPQPAGGVRYSFDVVAEAERQQFAWANDGAGIMPPGPPPPPYQTTSFAPVTHANRMIRRTSNISLVSAYVQQVRTSIQEIARNSGGYVENSNMSQWYSPRHNGEILAAHYTLRVPVGQFYIVNEQISALGEVTNFSTSSEDITAQFYDAQSRLGLRQQEEARLLYMIDAAQDLDDLLEIESRLANVRITIERYLRRMSELDYLAAFATIHISLHEADPIEPTIITIDNFWGRMGGGFASSVGFSITLLQNLAILVATVIVPVSVVAVPIGGWFIVRRRREKHVG